MTLLMRDKENIEKGFLQGLEKGATEEKLRMVKSLLQMNILSEEKIADAAGISLEELQEIKSSGKF